MQELTHYSNREITALGSAMSIRIYRTEKDYRTIRAGRRLNGYIEIVLGVWVLTNEPSEDAETRKWLDDLTVRHILHYRVCGCLGDSAECCDPSCPCHEGP